MQPTSNTERVAVASRTEQGRLCTVGVEPDPLGVHLLRYDGRESAVAVLGAEVIEGLVIALSVTGRTVVPARCPAGGACTLLAIGQRDRVRLYFHAAAAFCAVLDRAAAERLRTSLEQLRGR